METEILASRNAVDLLMRSYFDAKICDTNSDVGDPGYTYGFDC